jgi:hypothetical protein
MKMRGTAKAICVATEEAVLVRVKVKVPVLVKKVKA